jgi:hypothetical protein
MAALAVAAALYGWRERRRRQREVRPAFPDVRMAEVWQWWLEGLRDTADAALALPEGADVPERLRGMALAGLSEAERRASRSDHARLELRAAILEGTTLSLHLEALLEAGEPERKALLRGYAEGMDAWLRDSLTLANTEVAVLRQYAHWKFDDTAEDDWFHRFYRVARPYIREKARLAREALMESDAGSLRLVEIYDQLLQELTQKSLKAASKEHFARPDLH